MLDYHQWPHQDKTHLVNYSNQPPRGKKQNKSVHVHWQNTCVNRLHVYNATNLCHINIHVNRIFFPPAGAQVKKKAPGAKIIQKIKKNAAANSFLCYHNQNSQ